MTDLVLVNPNNRNHAPFAAIEPPLWLGLIAGYNMTQGKSVAVVDAEAEGFSVLQTVEIVNDYAWAKQERPAEILIVVMGNNPSVSSTPKMVVAEELLKHLPGARVTGLHPIAVKHPWCIEKPFEGFPRVPWHLLPMGKYRAHNWHCLDDVDKRKPYGVLYTSLNCPHSCFYCNIHTLYGDRKMRYRPLEDVYADLAYFASQGIRNIKVWDELFTLREDRVKQICDFIISQGYQFNIWAYARIDTINKELATKMKRAGFNWLAYGLESIKDKKVISKTHDVMEQTRDAGIHIMANFLFGLPDDSFDTMEASMEMAVEENFEYVNFNIALPYPGSAWYDSLSVKPTDWAAFNQFSPKVYAGPELIKCRGKLFKAYFERPAYLHMIKSKFGAKAEAHIKEMNQWEFR